MADRTILLYGSTQSGKSTQVGELAEHVHLQSGGKSRTRLYTADGGGYNSIQPHINLGLIEVVPLYGLNPWAYEWAVEGRVPKAGAKGIEWVVDPVANARIGAYAFEGFTSFGHAMMGSLARRAAKGENYGGEANVKINGNSPAAGEAGADGIVVGGSNKAHYNIVQNRLRDLAFRSMRLPGIVLWTALDQRGTDVEGMQTVLGPMLAGKAMAEVAPQWFNLSFHLVAIPQDGDKPPIHRMFVVPHKDITAPGALALAGCRQPLDVPDEKKLPQAITPTSLRRALELLQGAEAAATAKLQARLGIRG